MKLKSIARKNIVVDNTSELLWSSVVKYTLSATHYE